MDRKIKIFALISLVIAASLVASVVLAMESTPKTDANNSVGSDVQPTLSSVNGTENNSVQFINGNMVFGDNGGIGRGCRGIRGFGRPEELSGIQVSSDFTQNVTNIAKNDTDVQNLLNQGFNITSIRPIISTVIDANGNIVTKATTADLTLQGTTGRSFVVVDLNQAKVTKIVSITITEIDK